MFRFSLFHVAPWMYMHGYTLHPSTKLTASLPKTNQCVSFWMRCSKMCYPRRAGKAKSPNDTHPNICEHDRLCNGFHNLYMQFDTKHNPDEFKHDPGPFLRRSGPGDRVESDETGTGTKIKKKNKKIIYIYIYTEAEKEIHIYIYIYETSLKFRRGLYHLLQDDRPLPTRSKPRANRRVQCPGDIARNRKRAQVLRLPFRWQCCSARPRGHGTGCRHISILDSWCQPGWSAQARSAIS